MADNNDMVAKASQDLQTIEDFVNLPADSEVYPRLLPSVNVGTLSGTREAIFKAGGLPAKPFKTKALMTASALPDDSYAQVTDDTANNGLYLKTAGAWVKSAYDPLAQAKTYTNEKISEIDKFIETDLVASGIHDELGNYSVAVMQDGEFRAASLNTKELQVDGKNIVDLINQSIGNQVSAGNYPANLNHFEIYGQSLSQGAYSTPIQTTIQKYDSLMFAGGIRPQHPSYNVPDFYSDFIPLVEAQAIDGYVGYETPLGGATESVKQLIADENGITFDEQKYQLLGSACGEGGMSIADLTTTYFESNLKPAITNAYNLAQAKGMTYAMPVMGWAQGEQDNKPSVGTTIANYQTKLEALRVKIDNHLKTLNPKLALNSVIAGQLCSFKTSGRTEPHIELAIYEASVKPNNNVYLACPFYIFDYHDGYHIKGISSKWMGAYIGLVYKRVVVDGENWLPVHPISHVKQGKILEVKFHVPVQPLVFDTSHIAINTNYGFTLVDAAGTAITINSVSITQGDTVKIITATTIPDGAKLRYAWTPSAEPNRTTGPRGNLRDSQGDDLIFDPQGINKPMHNWTPILEYGV